MIRGRRCLVHRHRLDLVHQVGADEEIITAIVEYIRASAAESVQAAYQFKALHLAESGLAVGLNPNTRRGDLVLKQKIGPDSGFDVVINYEGARIPINYATDERLREAIYNLLIYWQLNAEEAGIAADSLADWIDNDKSARANGAEEEYYQNLAFSTRRGTRASSAWTKCSSCAAWMPWIARSRTGVNTSASMARARSICALSSKTCCSPSPAAPRTT